MRRGLTLFLAAVGQEGAMRKGFLLLIVLATARAAFATTWTVPGLANITGRNQTHFSSDLKVLNPGAVAAVATFELVLLNSGDAPPAPVTRTIGTGATFVSINALHDLFGL